MFSALQVSGGALLMLLVLLDVFLTVLYARAGTGIFSRILCAWEWRLIRQLAKLSGRRAQIFLAICGPAIVSSMIWWWAFLLTLGAALIFHPYLGSGVVSSSGSTPTDFISAMYAAANSISIVGSGGFSPRTSTFRLIFMFNSLVGMSIVSLTLTYLMQIYNALQQRNALGLHIYLLSGMTGRSAEMLVRIAPQGRIDSGFSVLSNLASSIAQLKEMHHFYPVLLYFRFQEAFYSVAFIVSMLVDCASLIQSAIDPTEYQWLQSSGTLAELYSGSLLLLGMIPDAFGPVKRTGTKQPAECDLQQWREHYRQSLDLFKSVGFKPAPDPQQGANRYVDLRREWGVQLSEFADSMLYPRKNLDPGTTMENTTNRVLHFRTRVNTSSSQNFERRN